MKKQTITKTKQDENLAYRLMGYSVLIILISLIPFAFTSVRLLYSTLSDTATQTTNTIFATTPIPLIAAITTIGYSFALLLSWTAINIAPKAYPLTNNLLIVTTGWFISILGTLTIWFIYAEKILKIDFF